MIQPGDKVLVIATVEANLGATLLVNINGHNIQIGDNQLACFQGEPVTNNCPACDGDLVGYYYRHHYPPARHA